MLVTIAPEQLDRLGRSDIAHALERGAIVYFPVCPIELPPEDDLRFMRERMPLLLKRKNISYHPEADAIFGIEGSPEEVERARCILKAHTQRVQAFMARIAPGLAHNWLEGTSSFRPLQEQGRNLSAHASNELIHVDAGAYGATHGDRVFRFFVNVNDRGEDRVWASKGSFPELYRRYARAAGIERPRIRENLPDRLWTGLVRLLARWLPAAKTALDTSPYDRAMRRFHNFMKDTPSFQRDPEGHQDFRFPPGSAWMCFTDMVSHACLSGQHCFVDTYIVPLANCELKELAPYYVLERGLA
jgi:hypothetical protein